MSELNGKLVTVFGGGGFVGRYVVQALCAAGARVRVAVRDTRGAVIVTADLEWSGVGVVVVVSEAEIMTVWSISI